MHDMVECRLFEESIFYISKGEDVRECLASLKAELVANLYQDCVCMSCVTNCADGRDKL